MSPQEVAQQRMAAQLIEKAVNDMRTDEALRWWPRSNYARALADVHEEVRAVLQACDIWYPGCES